MIIKEPNQKKNQDISFSNKDKSWRIDMLPKDKAFLTTRNNKIESNKELDTLLFILYLQSDMNINIKQFIRATMTLLSKMYQGNAFNLKKDFLEIINNDEAYSLDDTSDNYLSYKDNDLNQLNILLLDNILKEEQSAFNKSLKNIEESGDIKLKEHLPDNIEEIRKKNVNPEPKEKEDDNSSDDISDMVKNELNKAQKKQSINIDEILDDEKLLDFFSDEGDEKNDKILSTALKFLTSFKKTTKNKIDNILELSDDEIKKMDYFLENIFYISLESIEALKTLKRDREIVEKELNRLIDETVVESEGVVV